MDQYAEYVERWAIVVGISHYGHESLSLRYAHRDALDLCEWLQTPSGGGFPADHIVRLIDEEATTANVTRALRSFLQKPAREDIVVIYFACHGGPDPQRPGNIYLLTYDADPDDIAGTALPMREVDLGLRENLLAERVVIIADTCHSAAIGANRRNVAGSAEVNRYLKELSQSKPGTALLTSAEANETAQEGDEWGGGHGVFTHFLLEGLRGAADRSPADGTVTVGELFEYVRESVREATQGTQHPSIGPNAFDRRLPMAVTGDISSQEHLELGRCLYEFGRRLRDPALLDAAGRRLREADRLSTRRRSDVQTQIGKVLLALERKDQAVGVFREALGMDEDQADAAYYLSILDPTYEDALGRTFPVRFPDDPRAAFVERRATDPRAGVENRAIVVGIDEYARIPHLSKLQAFGIGASKNDARQMTTTLNALGFEPRNVTVLLDAAATKQKMLKAFRKLAEGKPKLGTFLFYYSGVGFHEGTRGLVAHDSADNSERVEAVFTTLELDKAIRDVPAMHRVLVIDGSIDEQLERLAVIGDYVVFSATSPHEQSHLCEDIPSGLFTSALVKELESAARPLGSIVELREKVAERMRPTVGQNPVVWGDPARPLVEARSPLDLAFELSENRYYGRYGAATLEMLLDWAETGGAHHPDLALSLARAFLDKRDPQRAIRAIRTMSAAAGGAALLLVVAHLSAGDTEGARAGLGQVVADQTDSSSRLDEAVARLLFAFGDYERAAAVCQKSLDRQSGARWDTHAILGLAKAFAGDQGAAAALTTCWEERPTTDEEDRLQRIVRFLATGESSPERHGILVGISAYPQFGLQAARGEAERLQDILTERFGFAPANLVMLLDRDATCEKIVGALEDAATHALGFDSFLFFFSGHSTCLICGPDQSGGYLDKYFPVDGVSAAGVDDPRAISGSRLHELICRIPAPDKTVILDGGGLQMAHLAGAGGDYLLLTSASPGQITWDGVFSTILIDELRRRAPGVLTAGDLIDAIAARMGGPHSGSLAKGSSPGPESKEQNPRLVGDRAGVLFQPKALGSFSERVAVARTMAQRAFNPMEIGRALQRYEYSASDSAVQILTRSLRTRPESRPETYLHLGIAFGLQGDYPRALDALSKAIAQSAEENFPRAHYYRGRFLFESATDYDQAVAELRLATRQNQTDPHAHYYLAQAIRAQVERQSRVEAAAAYRVHAAAGSPLGIDPDLVTFAVGAPHETFQTAPGNSPVAPRDIRRRKENVAKRAKNTSNG